MRWDDGGEAREAGDVYPFPLTHSRTQLPLLAFSVQGVAYVRVRGGGRPAGEAMMCIAEGGGGSASMPFRPLARRARASNDFACPEHFLSRRVASCCGHSLLTATPAGVCRGRPALNRRSIVGLCCKQTFQCSEICLDRDFCPCPVLIGRIC